MEVAPKKLKLMAPTRRPSLWRPPTSRIAPASSIVRFTAPRVMISRTARKSNSLLSNRKLNTSDATRRRPRKVLVDPARNVSAEEDAAARRQTSPRL